MKIILDTHSSDAEYNGDCDYAVVDMAPTLLKEIRSRIALVRQMGRKDEDVFELYFWGGTARFYDANAIEACQEAVALGAEPAGQDETLAVGDWMADFEANGHALLPVGVDLDLLQAQSTECDQLIVRRCRFSDNRRFEIAWTASPRHTDVYATTRAVPWEAVESYANGRQPAPQAVLR